MDEKSKQEIKSSRSSRVPCSTSPSRNASCKDSTDTRPPPRIKNYSGIFSPKPSANNDVPPVQKLDSNEHQNVGTQATESLIVRETGYPESSVQRSRKQTGVQVQDHPDGQLSRQPSSLNLVQLNKRADNEKIKQPEKKLQIHKTTRLSVDEAFEGRGGDRHRNTSRPRTKISPVKVGAHKRNDLAPKKPRSLTWVQKCFRKPANSASDNFTRISIDRETTGKNDKSVTKKNERRKKSNVSADKSKPRKHSSKLDFGTRTESTTSFLKLRSRGDLNNDEENMNELVMPVKSYLHLGKTTSRLARARSRKNGFSSESDESLWDRTRHAPSSYMDRGHGPIDWRYPSLPKSAPNSTNTPRHGSTVEYFRPKTSKKRDDYKLMQPGRKRRLSYSPPTEALKYSLKTARSSSPNPRQTSPESRVDSATTRNRSSLRTDIPYDHREYIMRQPSRMSRHLSRHYSRMRQARSRTRHCHGDLYRTSYADGSVEEVHQTYPKPVENICYQQTSKTYPISTSSDEFETYEGAPIKTYPSGFLRKEPRIHVLRGRCLPCGARKTARRGQKVLGAYSSLNRAIDEPRRSYRDSEMPSSTTRSKIPSAIFFNPTPRRTSSMDRSPDRTYTIANPRFPEDINGPFGMAVDVDNSLDDIDQQVTSPLSTNFKGVPDYLQTAEQRYKDGSLGSLPRPPFKSSIESENKSKEPVKTTDIGPSGGTDPTSLLRSAENFILQKDVEKVPSQGNWIFPQNPPLEVSPASSQPTVIAAGNANLETSLILQEKTTAAPVDKDVGDHIPSADANLRVKSDSALLETIMRMRSEDRDVKEEVVKSKPKTAVRPKRKVKPIVFPSIFTGTGPLAAQDINAVSSVMRRSSIFSSTSNYSQFQTRRPSPGRSPPPGCSSSFSSGLGNNPKDTRLRSLSLSPSPRKSVFTASRISFRGKNPAYVKKIPASTKKTTDGAQVEGNIESTSKRISVGRERKSCVAFNVPEDGKTSKGSPQDGRAKRNSDSESPAQQKVILGTETQTEADKPPSTVDKSTEPDIILEGEQTREVAVQPSFVQMEIVSMTEGPQSSQRRASTASRKSNDHGEQKERQRKRSHSLENRRDEGEDHRKILRVTDVQKTRRSSASPSPNNSTHSPTKESGEEKGSYPDDQKDWSNVVYPLLVQRSNEMYTERLQPKMKPLDQVPPAERQANHEETFEVKSPLPQKTIPIFNRKINVDENMTSSSTTPANWNRRSSAQEIEETRYETTLRNRSSPEDVKRSLSPTALANDRRSSEQDRRYWSDNLSGQRTPSPSYVDKKSGIQERSGRPERESTSSWSRANSSKLVEKEVQDSTQRDNYRGPPYFEYDEPPQRQQTQSKSIDRTSNRGVDDKKQVSQSTRISVSKEVPQKRSSSSQAHSPSAETDNGRHLQPERPRLRHLSARAEPKSCRIAEQFNVPANNSTAKDAPMEGRAKRNSVLESQQLVKPKEVVVEESRNVRTRSTRDSSRHTMTSMEVTESEMNALKHRQMSKNQDEREPKSHISTPKEKKMAEERAPKREDDAHQYASRKAEGSLRSISDQKKSRTAHNLSPSQPISQKYMEIKSDVTIKHQSAELDEPIRRPSSEKTIRGGSSWKILDDRLKKFPERTWSPKEWKENVEEVRKLIKEQRRLSTRDSTCNVEKDKCCKFKKPASKDSDVDEPCGNKKGEPSTKKLGVNQKTEEKKKGISSDSEDESLKSRGSEMTREKLQKFTKWNPGDETSNKMQVVSKSRCGPCSSRKSRDRGKSSNLTDISENGVIENLFGIDVAFAVDDNREKDEELDVDVGRTEIRRSLDSGLYQTDSHLSQMSIDQMLQKGILPTGSDSNTATPSTIEERILIEKLQDGTCEPRNREQFILENGVLLQLKLEKLRKQQQIDSLEKLSKLTFEEALIQAEFTRRDKIRALAASKERSDRTTLSRRTSPPFPAITAKPVTPMRSINDIIKAENKETDSKRSIDGILKEELKGSKRHIDEGQKVDVTVPSQRSVEVSRKMEIKGMIDSIDGILKEVKVESKRSLNEGLKVFMKPSLGKIPEVESMEYVKSAYNRLKLIDNPLMKQKSDKMASKETKTYIPLVNPKTPFKKTASGKAKSIAIRKIRPSPSQLIKMAKQVPNPKVHVNLPVPKPKTSAVDVTLDCLFSEILPMRLDRLRTKSDNFVTKLKKVNKMSAERKTAGRVSI